MKIRTGFVSNSSSSSFVVAFDRIPSSAEEMKKILFGDREVFSSPYGDDSWDTSYIAKIVYDDFCEQGRPLDYDEILAACDGMIYIDYYDDSKYKNAKGDINYDLVEAESKVLTKKEANKFISKNKGRYYYEFSYADENGSLGSAMEHGDLFSNVPHISISRH